jgi:hypothetical protein
MSWLKTVHSVDVAEALVGSTTVKSHVTTVRRLHTRLRSRLLGLVQGFECTAAEPAPAATQLSGTLTPPIKLPSEKCCRLPEVRGTSQG